MTNNPIDPDRVQIARQIKALLELDSDMLTCRIGAIGHHMRQVQPDRTPSRKGLIPMAKQCTHCTTIVRYEVDKDGRYWHKPVYDYPDDYLASGIGERIRPQAVRAVRARTLDQAALPPIVQHS